MSSTNFERERVSIGTDEVTLGEQLGAGAEGSVYELPRSDEVAKVFETERRAEKADKVRAMISNPPTDPTYDDGGRRTIIWPTRVVEDRSGSFLGYTMPRVNLDEYKDAQRYAREDLQWSSSTPEKRYKTAYNLAIMVDAIHKQGHAIGDLNHQNILVDDGYVVLIDCDAFHISGENDTYGDDTYFPRYIPPEGRGDSLGAVRKADPFGLGVHIFQLLMEGFHPFQAQGSEATSGGFGDMIEGNQFPYENPEPDELEPHDHAPDYDRLPADVRDLFADCFSETAKNQGWGRPSPDDWVDTLKQVSGLSETGGGGTGTGTGGGGTGSDGDDGDDDDDDDPFRTSPPTDSDDDESESATDDDDDDPFRTSPPTDSDDDESESATDDDDDDPFRTSPPTDSDDDEPESATDDDDDDDPVPSTW
ncbi:hypothetical protein [Haloplanus salilacus]|uniref:hypothetical protein n=1 Tax=Haloplanus salilacus TaxID=2949994 RepID=UPI0030D1D50F